MVALFGPLLYIGHDKISFPIPDQLPPIYPQIHRFQQYLRIRTDHPNPAYEDAVHFLKNTVEKLLPNASTEVHYFVPEKPLLIVTIQGKKPYLPSVLLNSHTDVVPAEHTKWDFPPFAARAVIADGQLRIYARGSQDMKSVGLQYVEALHDLLNTGWTPMRTIHISFVPDEETGGAGGMGKLVTSDVFKILNVGVALDEGLPKKEPKFNVYYGERQTWWLSIKVEGLPGHGYTMPEHTANSILHTILDNALYFRKAQYDMIQSGTDIGHIASVNIVYIKSGLAAASIKGGYTMNVIPSVAEAGLDIRVPPTIPKDVMEAEIDRWFMCDGQQCKGASYEWIAQTDNPVVTSRNPEKNNFITAFQRGMEKAGISDRLIHGIFPAASDARYLREAGIPCFGFSPIEGTPDLLHKHNEYITVNGYLNGCRIYQPIIRELADAVPPNSDIAELDVEEEESQSTELVTRETGIARQEQIITNLAKDDL